MISDAEMRKPVSFPRWSEALECASVVGTGQKGMFRRAIMGYRKHFKIGHRRASLASAKAYFDEEKSAGKERKEEREAVRWFFRAAKNFGGRRSEVGGKREVRNAQRPTFNS